MHEFDRRLMLKLVAGLSLAPYSALGSEEQGTIHVVRAGTDRTGLPHKAARANSHLDFKVLTHETNGALFVMENRDMVRGGPPRHVHYEQEEWFYFVEGDDDVLMEVGETKLRLKPGDSVFAPRNVPHVWAYLGQKPGRMLFCEGKRSKSVREAQYEARRPAVAGKLVGIRGSAPMGDLSLLLIVNPRNVDAGADKRFFPPLRRLLYV